MGKIAFVFSGQGDQHPGMGKALYGAYPAARAAFDLCDSIRPGTSAQCFSGTEAELQQTKNTQPCLYAMEIAAAAVLMAQGIRPDAAAGFSLGEVTAAAVCGLFDYASGFRLVCRRGELMQQAAEKFDTAMAAVVKLSAQQVEEICRRYPDVYPVNYNCPGQTTVSGLSAQMPAFCADVRAAGGRAIPLKVTGAFHSPFMAEAAQAFAAEVDAVALQPGSIPLYANQTAQPYGTDAAQLLSGQICHSVLWEQTVRNLLRSGVDTFIEIGPGATLTNMIHKICPEARAIRYSDCLTEVAPC